MVDIEKIKEMFENQEKEREQRQKEFWENLVIKDEDDIPHLPIPLTEWHCEKLFKAGAIRKKDLKDGKLYLGKCRNANKAKWDKKRNVFVYQRTKFGFTFPEDINHFEDDDGYDLFVPIKKLD